MPFRARYYKKSKQEPLFTPKKQRAFWRFTLICLIVILVSLIAVDNYRVVRRAQRVSAPSISADLEGYTILHLSDLQGQYIGAQHRTLIRSVENVSYQIVVISGDLTDSVNDREQQIQAAVDLAAYFVSLGKPVYYIPGDDDPARARQVEGSAVENELYTRLAGAGAQLLEAPVRLEAGKSGGAVWLWPFAQMKISGGQARRELSLLDAQDESFDALLLRKQYEGVLYAYENMLPTDVVVAVSHYPLTQEALDSFATLHDDAEALLHRVNVILAGHYHGGQICLPLIGPVWVPEASLGLHGFFPGWDAVRGLHRTGGVWQNITGGLGSTALLGVDISRVRLLCTPEYSSVTFTASPPTN